MNNLESLLRELKLSGMADSLAIRIKEAATNQMSFDEFLKLLATDELTHREQKRYESRYKKACFRGKKTIDSYDFAFNKKVNTALVHELATVKFIAEKAPVLIMGPCGTGKSHIAQAIGHCALQKGYTVLCTNQTKLSDMLQSAKAINGFQKKLKSLVKIDLLIIDDFGLKPLRSPEDENLHELIAERYEHASTIVTSNLSIDEWQHAFANKLLGVATVDRLQHNAYQLVMDGPSYRGKNKKKKS